MAKLAPDSYAFHTLTPCRTVDTRNVVGPMGGPALTCSLAPLPRTFPLAGACGVPSTARAISYNVGVAADRHRLLAALLL